MSVPDIEELLARTHDLASLPDVVIRAVDLINDRETSSEDIGRIISEDAGLTTRLLRVVNSSFYGFPSRIDTVTRAITVIGRLELLDLILATSVVKAFAGMPNNIMNMDDFWHHSLYTGIVARGLANRHRAPNTERYFVAGMIHNVGSLILYKQLPEESAGIIERTRNGPEFLHDVERDVLGYDHGELGAALLREWHLPEPLVESTAYHHRPLEAQQFRLETALVHIADIVTAAIEKRTVDTGQVPPFEPAAWEMTGLSEDILPDLVERSDEQFSEACELLLPRASAA